MGAWQPFAAPVATSALREILELEPLGDQARAAG
jgi:hypothetical protein